MKDVYNRLVNNVQRKPILFQPKGISIEVGKHGYSHRKAVLLIVKSIAPRVQKHSFCTPTPKKMNVKRSNIRFFDAIFQKPFVKIISNNSNVTYII